MNCENSIVIRAARGEIFAVTARLENWPDILPHYRWIRVLERDGSATIVCMAAWRCWLPIHWTSRFEADAAAGELRFHHLKAFTRGMDVKWTFTPVADGVLVRISHELDRRSLLGRWLAEQVLTKLFIQPIASQTLFHFKRHLEQTGTSVISPP